jgi:parallel beta-helix repeat protein
MCVCVLVLSGGVAKGGVIQINAAGTGDFPTIQEAIDAAVDGDQIVLAEGTYTGEGNKNLSLEGKTITLRSTNPARAAVVAATIIDCEGDGRAFHLYGTYETPATMIDGLTITNGNDSGIYVDRSSPTIRRCVIRNNSNDGSGGGIWCRQSGAQIIACRIVENSSGSASGKGGGIYLDRPDGATIAYCTICENVSLYYGGGIECSRSGEAVIRNCLIADNTTVHYDGAGISIWYNSSPVIANCVVSGNFAYGTFADGGGV